MKIRKGFVSNSSSSSFIVAVKKNTKVKFTGEVDLKPLADFVCEDEDDLIKALAEIDNDDKKLFTKCLKLIEEGNTILFGAFDDQSGDITEEAVCMCGIDRKNNPHVTVIENEAGY